MKKSLLAIFSLVLLAGSAVAGPRFGVYIGSGGGYGCGPRYYSAPVCYPPRVAYCAPRAVYYQSAPIYRCAPVVYAPVYRAPLITGGVRVSAGPVFGWRR